jgi:hypothetical protein
VAGVAPALLLVERARKVDREAVPLPVREAAGERADVLVAELLQRLGAERGAGASGAVDEDRARAIRGDLLDPGFEMAARDVDGAGDEALGPLVALAHVDEKRRLLRIDELARARRVDLGDLGLDLLQQLSIARHCFPKYSGHPVRSGKWVLAHA